MCINTDEIDHIEEEWKEKLANIDEEEPPEIEEMEEESESEAINRMKNSLVELYEEQVEHISQVQVCLL